MNSGGISCIAEKMQVYKKGGFVPWVCGIGIKILQTKNQLSYKLKFDSVFVERLKGPKCVEDVMKTFCFYLNTCP